MYNPNELLKIFFTKNFNITTVSIAASILLARYFRVLDFPNHAILSFFINMLFWFCLSFTLISTVHYLNNKLKKPKRFKYCPDCMSTVNIKSRNKFCTCGTKYLLKCSNCNAKFKSQYVKGNCLNCGFKFPTSKKSEYKWMLY